MMLYSGIEVIIVWHHYVDPNLRDITNRYRQV